MRWWLRISAVLALTGCNAVFGLDATQSPPDATTNCPQSYTTTSTGMYRVETTAHSFADAEAACEADAVTTARHTHLAVAASDGELNVLYALAQQSAATDSVWLGLNDGPNVPTPCTGTVQGYWWITDELAQPVPQVNLPWNLNEPDTPCDQHCVNMVTVAAKLADAQCTFTFPFICECDDFAADPTHYTP